MVRLFKYCDCFTYCDGHHYMWQLVDSFNAYSVVEAEVEIFVNWNWSLSKIIMHLRTEIVSTIIWRL